MPQKSDHDLLVEIYVVLLGANGQNGLCREFGKLRKLVYGVVIFLTSIFGVGGASFGIAELVKRISG